MSPEYRHFNEDDFINDEFFQSWVLGECNEQDNDFWKNFLNDNPYKAFEVEKAVKILKGIALESESDAAGLSDEKVKAAFDQISRILGFRIAKKSGDVKQLRSRQRWLWAAAVAVLVFGSAIVFRNYFNQQKSSPVAVVKNDPTVLKPGGQKAVLVLADGTEVVLDSAENGQLAAQGNMRVIKLDSGRIAYKGDKGNAQEVVYNVIKTPVGGQYQLILSDGTKVWLNAASSLRFPTAFSGTTREVELSGEGYFEVKRDVAKPFFVRVGNMNVKVLGTHFNIKAYLEGASIKTTLLEGKVEVESLNKSVLLKPGEQARLEAANNKLSATSDVDLEEVLAWKNGYFQFNRANIHTILAEAARWYGADISYDGDVDETFSGSLPRSESISQLLDILAATNKVEFKIIGKQIIVKPK